MNMYLRRPGTGFGPVSPAIKTTLLALAMGVASVSAQAGTVTVGTVTATTPANLGSFLAGSTLVLGDLPTNASTAATKTFYDDFVFTIPVGESITSISASLNTGGFLGITGFTESLYSGGGTITAFSTSGTNPFGTTSALQTNSSVLATTNLGAGTYTLQFSGVLAKATTVLGVTVPAAGAYASTVAFSMAAVPEPSSYALMFAGLGIAGLVARRRRSP